MEIHKSISRAILRFFSKSDRLVVRILEGRLCFAPSTREQWTAKMKFDEKQVDSGVDCGTDIRRTVGIVVQILEGHSYLWYGF